MFQKNKNVLLLSTLHEDDTIDKSTGDACKPEVIMYYNRNKTGVDTVDQLKSIYSVARITCRWPLTVFFSMLNIAGINGFIIFRSNNVHLNMPRRLYLKSLARELVQNHMKKRLNQNLPSLLSLQMKNYLGILPINEQDDNPTVPQGRPKCTYCPKKKNRKTSVKCAKCQKPICKEHTLTYCAHCVQSDSE